MPEEVIDRDTIDDYLIAQGYMPSGATAIERNAFCNDFLKLMRTASVSKLMRDVGLEPFDVHCQSDGWQIEPLVRSVERQKPARKLFSQAKRSSLQQRRIQHTLDPVLDQKAYLQSHVTMEVTNIYEKIGKSMEPLLQESVERIRNVFEYVENLRMKGPEAA
jgi:hypothetical protein